MNKKWIACILLLCGFIAAEAQHSGSGYEFSAVKELKITPVKNQSTFSGHSPEWVL